MTLTITNKLRRERLVGLAAVIVVVLLCVLPLHAWAQGSSTTHRVQPGETLFRIALKYGVTVEALSAANNITNPDQISVGEILTIPASATNPNADSTQEAVPPSSPTATSIPVYYTVRAGDTLNVIAKKYGITGKALIAANNLTNPDRLEIGQKLLLPGVTPTPTPEATGAATAAGTPTSGDLPLLDPLAAPTDATTGTVTPVAPDMSPTVTQIAPAAPTDMATLAPTSAATDVATDTATDIATDAATATATATIPPTARIHIVKAGEGLASIARDYGLTWTTIAEANHITDPNLVYTGMTLQIPASDPSSTDMEASAGVPPVPPPAPNPTGKLILVVLHEQRVYMYEDSKLVRNVLVSTGMPGTPTVTGDYKIYAKYDAQLMTGPGYYLPSVPWVMYFYQGYGLHGTYWHHNWGHTMSHGCVNMPTSEAKWLYDWSEIGTPVHVEW